MAIKSYSEEKLYSLELLNKTIVEYLTPLLEEVKVAILAAVLACDDRDQKTIAAALHEILPGLVDGFEQKAYALFPEIMRAMDLGTPERPAEPGK